MTSAMTLPRGDSPTLALVHPTEKEQLIQSKLNGAEWRGALSPAAYLRREITLSQQALTKDGGITYWILVDNTLDNNPLEPSSGTRLPLASCETYRKKALVWRDGKLQEVVSHGIGSVFCGKHLRKRGYAQRMMTELGKTLQTHQTDENECLFTILYSDIGKVSSQYLHTSHNANAGRNSIPTLAGSHSPRLTSHSQQAPLPLLELFPLLAHCMPTTSQSCVGSTKNLSDGAWSRV